VAIRERDPQPEDDAFCYTTLLNLAKILDGSWGTLSGSLPRVIASNKQRFLSDLARLNRIRNAVMHPVRNAPPTEDDFIFVRALHSSFHLSRDADDDVVLATAVAAGASLIVTGDQDLLVIGRHNGVDIVSLRDFLRRLSS
jgi:putative PIN family toxin of toxin-antitoxin system